MPIVVALLLFPFIALLLLLPFYFVNFRRYGILPRWRMFVFFLGVWYLLCVGFYVTLPLPEPDALICEGSRWDYAQLHPFASIREIWTYAERTGSFINRATFQVLMNVIMFVPLGFFLGYLFKFSWGRLLFWSFVGSLLLELTQLTGNWFIYPCPYRLFDVDDLLCNTLGAAIGAFIAMGISRFLPKIDPPTKQKRMPDHVRATTFAAATMSEVLGIIIVPAIAQLIQLRAGLSAGSDRVETLVWLGITLVILPLIVGRSFGGWVVADASERGIVRRLCLAAERCLLFGPIALGTISPSGILLIVGLIWLFVNYVSVRRTGRSISRRLVGLS